MAAIFTKINQISVYLFDWFMVGTCIWCPSPCFAISEIEWNHNYGHLTKIKNDTIFTENSQHWRQHPI